MTDPMELVGRIDGILTDNGTDYHPILRCALTEAAACIREMVEKKPFAYFQWNEGWHAWEQVVDDAAGEDGVVAAYRLPPAPGAEA